MTTGSTQCTVEQGQTDTHFLLGSRDGSAASAGYLPSLSDPYVQVQCYPSTSPTRGSPSRLLSPAQEGSPRASKGQVPSI